ncbi:MAG: electron transport complex subunit RsxC [Limnochordia bacterium]|jgi:electron transport complex protein RnfC
MDKTFAGGIHPFYAKELAESKPIEKMPLPAQVTIHLQQHVGSPGKPVVEKGDEVKLGQIIGEADAFVSAYVHASVSGTVLAVEPRLHPTGGEVTAVVIENDGQDQWAEGVGPRGDLQNLSSDEIRKIVYEAGIVGLGGGAFPTHVKLTVPPEKEAHTLIINGCECEAYLTGDHRLMLERPEDIIFGAQAMAKALGAEEIIFGIENNKPDAIEKLRALTKNDSRIKVESLETKYPQGGEKQLISSLLDREVPSGGLPIDVGVIVQNVATAVAVSDAIKHGRPLVERVITVSGPGVKEPKNVLVRIGTPVADIIEYAGGFVGTPGKVILGGPLTGIALHDLQTPICKGTSGVIVLPREEIQHIEPMACIRCGRCVDACPARLMPVNICKFAQRDMLKEAEEYGAIDCIECGSCSYVCPAKIHLLHWILLVKNQILAQRRQQG